MGEHDPSEASALRHFLADRDAPCPGCGYNLRGLASDRCPECNNAVRLTVGLVDHGIGSLVAAAIGLGACGAAAAVLLGICGWLWIRRGSPTDEEFVILFVIPAVVVALDAAGVFILVSRRARARFLNLRSGRRLLVVAACWGTSGVVVVAWTWLMLRNVM